QLQTRSPPLSHQTLAAVGHQIRPPAATPAPAATRSAPSIPSAVQETQGLSPSLLPRPIRVKSKRVRPPPRDGDAVHASSSVAAPPPLRRRGRRWTGTATPSGVAATRGCLVTSSSLLWHLGFGPWSCGGAAGLLHQCRTASPKSSPGAWTRARPRPAAMGTPKLLVSKSQISVPHSIPNPLYLPLWLLPCRL
ncbi:unnamed protein product, partial [Urochloa humidicola]